MMRWGQLRRKSLNWRMTSTILWLDQCVPSLPLRRKMVTFLLRTSSRKWTGGVKSFHPPSNSWTLTCTSRRPQSLWTFCGRTGTSLTLRGSGGELRLEWLLGWWCSFHSWLFTSARLWPLRFLTLTMLTTAQLWRLFMETNYSHLLFTSTTITLYTQILMNSQGSSNAIVMNKTTSFQGTPWMWLNILSPPTMGLTLQSNCATNIHLGCCGPIVFPTLWVTRLWVSTTCWGCSSSSSSRE